MLQMHECLSIHLDFETYSEVDLTKIGAYQYADHPSTDVLLASYKAGEGQVRQWRPGDRYPFEKYHDRLGKDAFILAWNSNFERIMWWQKMCEKHGWPKPPMDAFICVATWARSTAASPSKLERAAMFFDVPVKKDMKGHRLMLQMCKPATDAQQVKYYEKYRSESGLNPVAGNLDFAAKRCHHTPENLDQLGWYCDDDVRAEAGIADILPPWRWDEIDQFWESERINDHGICVDVDFAHAASQYAEEEKKELAEALIDITDDPGMTPRTFQRFKEWALPRMSREAIKLTEWYDKGVKKNSFDADVRSNLLAAAQTDPEFLDPDVYDAIDVLDEAGKSTISKFQAIADRATSTYTDGCMRVHGLYMYAGAAQSGRYSSVGIQAHNLVRDVPDEAPGMIEAFVNEDRRAIRAYGKPIHILGQLVRPTLTGDPGDEFDIVWGDWSSIEAICLPWLANDADADNVLAVFRRGEDIYLKTASDILGRKITKGDKQERQAYGKVPTLSLGYGGGLGAFQAMAKNYGVRLDDDTVDRIVKRWRKANPWAQRFGKALDTAAKWAMKRPGVTYTGGRIGYIYCPGDLGGMGCLYAILPSGRYLPYPDPGIEAIRKEWGVVETITCRKGAWTPAKDAVDWPRVSLWSGLLAENVTQAACADILNAALLRCKDEGYTVAGHTHDEIILEAEDPCIAAKHLKTIMETKPDWPGADALPLKAEVEFGYRYKVPFES